MLPAVFDPEAARAPGAPLVHGDKTPVRSRIAEPGRNVVAQMHDEHGERAGRRRRGLAPRPPPWTGTWRTARVTHAALETHGARAWLDARSTGRRRS